MMRRYGLDAGRCITINGKAAVTLNHVTYNGVPFLSPSDADILAHRIVNALNDMEFRRMERTGICPLCEHALHPLCNGGNCQDVAHTAPDADIEGDNR